MRLKELVQAEVRYLIFNGWARHVIRGEDQWFHPDRCPMSAGLILTLDDAVRIQKGWCRGAEIRPELLRPAPVQTSPFPARYHGPGAVSHDEPAPDTQPSSGLPARGTEPPRG